MPRTTNNELLETARRRLERLGPHEASAAVARGAVRVDIRPVLGARRREV